MVWLRVAVVHKLSHYCTICNLLADEFSNSNSNELPQKHFNLYLIQLTFHSHSSSLLALIGLIIKHTKLCILPVNPEIHPLRSYVSAETASSVLALTLCSWQGTCVCVFMCVHAVYFSAHVGCAHVHVSARVRQSACGKIDFSFLKGEFDELLKRCRNIFVLPSVKSPVLLTEALHPPVRD